MNLFVEAYQLWDENEDKWLDLVKLKLPTQ